MNLIAVAKAGKHSAKYKLIFHSPRRRGDMQMKLHRALDTVYNLSSRQVSINATELRKFTSLTS